VGYSLGGPIVRDRAHFFSSLEYIGVRSTDTVISWVPTPEFLAASSAATSAYFDAYGKGITINGPTLTRGHVSSIIGAGAFNALAACNLFNHHNLYAHTDAADISSATAVTGYLSDQRRMQLGFKFEF
jgi:hypothetical protein